MGYHFFNITHPQVHISQMHFSLVFRSVVFVDDLMAKSSFDVAIDVLVPDVDVTLVFILTSALQCSFFSNNSIKYKYHTMVAVSIWILSMFHLHIHTSHVINTFVETETGKELKVDLHKGDSN